MARLPLRSAVIHSHRRLQSARLNRNLPRHRADFPLCRKGNVLLWHDEGSYNPQLFSSPQNPRATLRSYMPFALLHPCECGILARIRQRLPLPRETRAKRIQSTEGKWLEQTRRIARGNVRRGGIGCLQRFAGEAVISGSVARACADWRSVAVRTTTETMIPAGTTHIP